MVAGDARQQLGEAWATAMAAAGNDNQRAIESNRVKPLRSPVIIIVSQQDNPDRPERDLEDYAAVAAATQNLLLAATVEGLVSKWSTGDPVTDAATRTFCNLAPRDRIVALVYLGHPDATQPTPKAPDRTPPHTTWHGWPEA